VNVKETSITVCPDTNTKALRSGLLGLRDGLKLERQGKAKWAVRRFNRDCVEEKGPEREAGEIRERRPFGGGASG